MKTLRPYQQDAFNKLRTRLREVTHPLLVNASVGAGKTLIIASYLQLIEKANFHALCLTMNSNLIEQNADSYIGQGGACGIFCTSLGKKESKQNIIFASPHSIVQAIKKNHIIKEKRFNLIIIDECHNVNHHDNASMYMRILNHYGMLAQFNDYNYRVVGLTGTPYRGKNISIVGEKEYFREEIVSILMPWLIDNDYLVQPIFGKTQNESYDMARLPINNAGKFKHKDLQAAVDKKARLTGKIMQEIVSIIEGGRTGAFIFAATAQHANECMASLPAEQAAIITADTPHAKRKQFLDGARNGTIKYLVSVATLMVGVDVPNFDVCAWLRITESLIIFTQGIGRVLRLSPNKKEALILDYAGNLERHGDIDDPIINVALQPKPEDEPQYCIPCYTCGTNNKPTARRCIGQHKEERCSYYFTFKPCTKCNIENDITARYCRSCEAELIDPNKKLDISNTTLIEFDVNQAQYWVTRHSSSTPIINIRYQTSKQDIYENYYTMSDKAVKFFYGRFIKQHVKNSSKYYPYLNNLFKMQELVHSGLIDTPYKIICKLDSNNKYRIVKKLF